MRICISFVDSSIMCNETEEELTEKKMRRVEGRYSKTRPQDGLTEHLMYIINVQTAKKNAEL